MPEMPNNEVQTQDSGTWRDMFTLKGTVEIPMWLFWLVVGSGVLGIVNSVVEILSK